MVKISVLVDNAAYEQFLAQHGLSFYIQHNGYSLLFDTGYNRLFRENAQKLNINVDNADAIVLSHGHWDHGDGLEFINNKPLICHPGVFMKRYRKPDKSYIGLKMSKALAQSAFELITSEQPYRINENIYFLGQIPRNLEFENQKTTFIDEKGLEDKVPDDSAIAIVNKSRLVIISGCAHAGICNTVDYAKKVTGVESVTAVMGGFHLKYNNAQTQSTIAYFKEQKIPHILPSHCTALPALSAFYEAFNMKHIKAGMQVSF